MSNAITTTKAKSAAAQRAPRITKAPTARVLGDRISQIVHVTRPNPQVPSPKAQVPFPTAKVPVPSAKEVLNLSPFQPPANSGKPSAPTTSAIPPEKTDPALEHLDARPYSNRSIRSTCGPSHRALRQQSRNGNQSYFQSPGTRANREQCVGTPSGPRSTTPRL
jgi:hypothetical protein